MRDDPYRHWLDNEILAHQMIPLVGELWNRQGIEIKVFGKSLVDETPLSIMQIIRKGNMICDEDLDLPVYQELLDVISKMGLGLCRIDLGKMVLRYTHLGARYQSARQFVRSELGEEFFNTDRGPEKPKDIVLYGFGRIGRVLTRLLIAATGPGRFFRLRGVIVRGKGDAEDLEKRAELLRHDSVHGPFSGLIDTVPERSELVINGNRVKFIFADDPSAVDYPPLGLDDVVVVDNSGRWRDRNGLSRHLRPGVSRVALTAPGKGDIPNIVFGINDDKVGEEAILSSASCTTNAVAPVLKMLSDEYGIRHGHIETVHSYTNDQNLLDNYHKAERRGRSAPLNMVITTTGAASAVVKVLPELKGKLTGNSIRVPTPNVSLAMLNLSTERKVGRDDLNDFLRRCALHSRYQKQIGYTKDPLVSTDLGHSIYTGVVDSQATLAHDEHVVLYIWYDNEFGYSHQVKRLVRKICGDTTPEYIGAPLSD